MCILRWAFPPGLKAERLLCLSFVRVRGKRGHLPFPLPAPARAAFSQPWGRGMHAEQDRVWDRHWAESMKALKPLTGFLPLFQSP